VQDFPFEVALLGQFSHVHFPGAHEQTSPHEQADLPLSVDLLGQFSQVHCPGAQVHSSLQLPISPPPHDNTNVTYEQVDFLFGQLAQVHCPGAHEQVSLHEQDLPLFTLLGQLAQVHAPGAQVHSSLQLPCQL
jgi:hypothetical protein